MTNAEKYAKMLQRDYGIKQTAVKLDDKTFNTVDKVARKVLPTDKYQQWENNYTAKTNALRKQFGIKGRI